MKLKKRPRESYKNVIEEIISFPMPTGDYEEREWVKWFLFKFYEEVKEEEQIQK